MCSERCRIRYGLATMKLAGFIDCVCNIIIIVLLREDLCLFSVQFFLVTTYAAPMHWVDSPVLCRIMDSMTLEWRGARQLSSFDRCSISHFPPGLSSEGGGINFLRIL